MRVLQERHGLGRRGQEADHVQINTAQEGNVVQRRRRLELVPGKVDVQEAVNGVFQAGTRGRQHGPPRLQRSRVELLLEREACFPGQSLIDPRPKQVNLLGR